MIANIGNIVFSEGRIEKYKKLSNILLLLGLVAILAFPYMGQETFIEEKHVKHSSALSQQVKMDEFDSDQKEYFSFMSNTNVVSEKIKENELALFALEIFNQNTLENNTKIMTKEFSAPRGDKRRFIMINLIYDLNGMDRIRSLKGNSIIYSLMKFLRKPDRITWLAKDIQFNYIRKDHFFNSPKPLYEILIGGQKNKKIIDGQGLDAIYNFDLTKFDFENIDSLLIKQNGMSSENNDMDYYNIFSDNIYESFKTTTNSAILSNSSKAYLRKMLTIIGGYFEKVLSKPTKDFHYVHAFVYLFENVLDNFLLINNKINFNHLLISKGYNSMLIQVITKKGEIQMSRDYLTKGKIEAFKFLSAIQKSIKTISKNEIDLFRGQYHFVFIGPRIFVGYIFLVIPILMIIRIFYEVLETIYTIEFLYITDDKNTKNGINASKVLSHLIAGMIPILLLFFHINDVNKYIFKSTQLNSYYYLIGGAFASAILIFTLMRPNKREIQFVDNIIRFVLALNCFNIIFINIGLGIIITGLVLSLELLLLILDKINKHFLKVFIIGFIMYSVLTFKPLIISMIENYSEYCNNVYGIISITLVLFAYRMIEIVFQLLGKKKEDQEEAIKVKTD